jgi:hypothetical protein
MRKSLESSLCLPFDSYLQVTQQSISDPTTTEFTNSGFDQVQRQNQF